MPKAQKTCDFVLGHTVKNRMTVIERWGAIQEHMMFFHYEFWRPAFCECLPLFYIIRKIQRIFLLYKNDDTLIDPLRYILYKD